MAYSPAFKQRAVFLSSQGRPAGEVFQVLARLFPNQPMPDERTIRRWRKKAEPLKPIGQDHAEQLTDVLTMLLEDIPDNSQNGNYDTTNELSADDTANWLDYNYYHSISPKHTDWFFYCCFCIHLVYDLPAKDKGKNYWELVWQQPIELVRVLRTIKARGTFKGTCPVCKDWPI